MPWQLSGNGRSDWSTKLIRGLKAEAAAGFQSRRERCSEPTPATPQYAAFSTYKAARAYGAHANGVRRCPLSGVKQTLQIAAMLSAACHRTRNGWRVHGGFILNHENLGR